MMNFEEFCKKYGLNPDTNEAKEQYDKYYADAQDAFVDRE